MSTPAVQYLLQAFSENKNGQSFRKALSEANFIMRKTYEMLKDHICLSMILIGLRKLFTM